VGEYLTVGVDFLGVGWAQRGGTDRSRWQRGTATNGTPALRFPEGSATQSTWRARETDLRVSRRRLLAVSASTACLLAGCNDRSAVTSPTSGTPTDAPEAQSRPTSRFAPHLGSFVFWNDDDERHRVTLTVSTAGDVVVDETRDLPPDTTADVENPIGTQGVYAVVARVDGERRAERTWRVERCASVEYLQLHVDDAGGVELRTMRQTVDPPLTCG
jgi:hypothetical protein